MYKPPFSITNSMMNESLSIADKISKISIYDSLDRMPILRRNNTIKSIHSSLAIEANSLSLNQVKDVLDGKPVIGSLKEIQEVKNAYKAYERIGEFNGYDENDLKIAHGILMSLIDDDAGEYRNHGEGIFDGEKVIFMAPGERMVPVLMANLFSWLKSDSETPILLKSCIFHYEFVFIHPFSDGNGRTARLWQNVLLSKWNKVFEHLPIETEIKKYQSEYYEAIEKCHKSGNSNVFIEFMLKMINKTLDDVLVSCKNESKNISYDANRLLSVMEFDIPLSANEIMRKLGIKSKETLRKSYLGPAIRNGLVKMTLPEKPNSKNQKYYK